MRTVGGVDTLGRVCTADAYVTALDAALRGPARVRRGLVREARDHLDDAAAALSAAGYERGEAERIAVREFGELDDIVPAFQTTLAVAASRRTSWMLLTVLAVQPLLWDGPFGADDRPAPDGAAFAVLDHAVEWGGGLLIATAVAMVVVTGIGNRWFAAGRRVARLTARTAIAAAACIEVLALGMVVLSSGTEPVSWLLFLAFILAPLGLTTAQARQTLASC